MDASPAAALEVIPAEFFLDFAEAGFDVPPPKRDPEQVAERPAIAPGNAIAEEEFRLAGQHIASDDQRSLTTDQAAAAARLSPTSMPFDLPDFGAVAGVLGAIHLRLLRGKARRVLGQVLHFPRAGIATCQTRIVCAAPLRFGLIRWRFLQHGGLFEPDVKVRRDLADKGLATLVESVQELAVARVEFIKRPGFDPDAVGGGAIDQVERDLRLGLELDFVGEVVFFRRTGSLAHSSGRYNRASSRQ